jgi:Tfp pilus assembly protein PilN
VRAVNLIPSDLRGAGAGGAGRSGIGVYLLLGGLALAVVIVAAWTVSGRQVTDKQNELNRVTAEAQGAQQRAARLVPYKVFSELRAKRVETVTELSRSRFNWPYALREVSRVLPENVWLTNLSGTVAPGVQVEDAGTTSTANLRNGVQSPAIELKGCTLSQDNVARYLARLRGIEGVTRVSLAQSEKLDAAAATGGGDAGPAASSDGDCRQGDTKIPQFEGVVFFETSTATVSGPAAGGPAPVQQEQTGGSQDSGGSEPAGDQQEEGQ